MPVGLMTINRIQCVICLKNPLDYIGWIMEHTDVTVEPPKLGRRSIYWHPLCIQCIADNLVEIYSPTIAEIKVFSSLIEFTHMWDIEKDKMVFVKEMF